MTNWGIIPPKFTLENWWVYEATLQNSGKGLLSAVWVLLSPKPDPAVMKASINLHSWSFIALLISSSWMHTIKAELHTEDGRKGDAVFSRGSCDTSYPQAGCCLAWGRATHSNVLCNVVKIYVPNYWKYIIL